MQLPALARGTGSEATGGRNPLTGLSGLQQAIFLPFFLMESIPSQSPYGAKWFATSGRGGLPLGASPRSQSPYGAKWFATWWARSSPTPWPALGSRNPLTGLSGLQPDQADSDLPHRQPPRRNPLTGLSGLQHGFVALLHLETMTSQSPYGAKWFATRYKNVSFSEAMSVAIPLRG